MHHSLIMRFVGCFIHRARMSEVQPAPPMQYHSRSMTILSRAKSQWGQSQHLILSSRLLLAAAMAATRACTSPLTGSIRQPRGRCATACFAIMNARTTLVSLFIAIVPWTLGQNPIDLPFHISHSPCVSSEQVQPDRFLVFNHASQVKVVSRHPKDIPTFFNHWRTERNIARHSCLCRLRRS